MQMIFFDFYLKTMFFLYTIIILQLVDFQEKYAVCKFDYLFGCLSVYLSLVQRSSIHLSLSLLPSLSFSRSRFHFFRLMTSLQRGWWKS